LTLEQAGAFVAEHRSSFRDYLASYRGKGLELLERLGPVAGEHSESVATTWRLNFDQVEQVSPAAADLLRASAFFGPDRIPLELVREGAGELSPELAHLGDDPLALEEVLEPLTQYSLIRRDIDDESYTIHWLVQMLLKHQMDEGVRRQWAERCVRAVNRAFPNPEEIAASSLCERLLPHTLASAQLMQEWQLASPEAGLLCDKVGFYLYQRGRYQEAEPLYQRALKICEDGLGQQHPNTITVLKNYATLLRRMGWEDEALALERTQLASSLRGG
jgi:tetratricopeptide (TPR) repeat protein